MSYLCGFYQNLDYMVTSLSVLDGIYTSKGPESLKFTLFTVKSTSNNRTKIQTNLKILVWNRWNLIQYK